MASEKQILELTKLMSAGVFTSEEFSKLINALSTGSEKSIEETEAEQTPAAKAYSEYIRNTVALGFKSPSAVVYPPFNPSMVKQGVIKLDFTEQECRYIETYVDAPNSYGAMLRSEIIIGIDDEFNPLFWAQHVSRNNGLGKTKSWVTSGQGDSLSIAANAINGFADKINAYSKRKGLI